MFLALFVVGLLCSITPVLGLDCFPYMMLSCGHGDQEIGVHYSTTMNKKDVRYRSLNRKEVYNSLQNRSYAGKQAVIDLKSFYLRPGQNCLVVNDPINKKDHWMSVDRTSSFYFQEDPDVAKLINQVCTQQLDAQPSIIVVPFKNNVHIQYPIPTSDDKPGRYILKTDVQTEDFRSALTEMEGAENLIFKFNSNVQLNPDPVENHKIKLAEQVRLRHSGGPAIGKRKKKVDQLIYPHEVDQVEKEFWESSQISHQDTTMKFIKLDDENARIICQVCTGKLGIELPEVPVYIGHKE